MAIWRVFFRSIADFRFNSPFTMFVQRPGKIHINEKVLIRLSEKAKLDNSQKGYLYKRTADQKQWRMRYFILYQNMLFYFESEEDQRLCGVIFLEGCYCERTVCPSTSQTEYVEDGFVIEISFQKDSIRSYELKATTEMLCDQWLQAIRKVGYNGLKMANQELDEKHRHLVQILELEKKTKWRYAKECEDLDKEVKRLKVEMINLRRQFKLMPSEVPVDIARSDANSPELRKIKKVQSFFRGWLCRRRWKQIVEQYIKSPHAEIMRKRNSLVFQMLEAEEEYVDQLEILMNCFMRPLKMAASSKKPPCTHDDVSAIFLNCETVLFLHQIFLKGLTSRVDNWPNLVLADLFTILLPMLTIYQEYVRNHHYSIQVLTGLKQIPAFHTLLQRLEEKPACRGRTLETFLTYPMHQIPRYIITLQDIIAHTPHEHVESKTLTEAKQQLEELSRIMHDEVSETENLRKNLSVERMIIEGCDLLLDNNQIYVRQGTLVQVPCTGSGKTKVNFKCDKEVIRQCFLFSNHLIITTRSNSGRLHLVPVIGKIALKDVELIEDPSEDGCNGDANGRRNKYNNCDFKLIVTLIEEGTNKLKNDIVVVHLLSPTRQEKLAWISDISQCLENISRNDILKPAILDNSSVCLPHCVKNDNKLFEDEADIKFSRTLNSCKVPQIRYATSERLLARLADLRFLSIDFLNTFLLTYRIFTDAITLLNTLKNIFSNTDFQTMSTMLSQEDLDTVDENLNMYYARRRSSLITPRRISGASTVSGYYSEPSDHRDRSHSYDSRVVGHRRRTLERYEEEPTEEPVQVKVISPTNSEKNVATQIRVSIDVHYTEEPGPSTSIRRNSVMNPVLDLDLFPLSEEKLSQEEKSNLLKPIEFDPISIKPSDEIKPLLPSPTERAQTAASKCANTVLEFAARIAIS